ncbi:MAG TPA: hypothetical protein VHZ03_02625 [Trebonia sp.]|nr:hypothetical protein [Trebonia sp.]
MGTDSDGVPGTNNDGVPGTNNVSVSGTNNDGIPGTNNDSVSGTDSDGVPGTDNDGVPGSLRGTHGPWTFELGQHLLPGGERIIHRLDHPGHTSLRVRPRVPLKHGSP